MNPNSEFSGSDSTSVAGWNFTAAIAVALLVFDARAQTPVQQSPALAPVAFAAPRLPDTVELVRPYRVRLRELSGKAVLGGQLRFTASSLAGPSCDGEVPLRFTNAPGEWLADIPGQPVGAEICYHFELNGPDGVPFRHPARAQAAYRFRVVGLVPVDVRLPQSAPVSPSVQFVELGVRSLSTPGGILRLRRLAPGVEPMEHSLPLLLREPPGPVPEHVWTLAARLPALAPGELADLHFHLTNAAGHTARAPAGAPEFCYTLKAPFRRSAALPVDAGYVLDVRTAGEDRWVATRGAGLWRYAGDQLARRWSLGAGLPAATATFVLPDSAAGHAWVGTETDVVRIEPSGALPVIIAGPSRTELEGSPGWRGRAGPAALSALDGTLLFQMQGEPDFESPTGRAVFLEMRDGRLAAVQPALPFASLTAATFDANDGVWLLAGLAPGPDETLRPMVLRRAGALNESAVLPNFNVANDRVVPERVAAVARDPLGSGPVIALTFRDEKAARQRHGVFRVNPASGELTPFASDVTALDAEILSLATDWPRRRLLLGLANGGVRAAGPGPSSVPPLPSPVTALDASTDTLVAGTGSGAWAWSGLATNATLFHTRTAEALPADALPMDVHPETGAVLLSSYREGLMVLERTNGAGWRVARRLRPGHELPAGLFGEARFGTDGSLWAILHSQGLLRVPPNQPARLLRTNDGLLSPHLLQVLARASGEIWIAHTPVPFTPTAGGALQVLRDDRVVRTVPLDQRDLATIARWLEWPGRGSVLAATRAGVAEFAADGSATILTRDAMSALAFAPGTNGVLGAAGTTVLRWEGERFVPVLFQVNHPRRPAGRFFPGSPLDLAIDTAGAWYLLFPNGVLAVLDSAGEPLATLDAEDGLPPTARRCLVHPHTGEICVGSATDGVVIFAPASPARKQPGNPTRVELRR